MNKIFLLIIGALFAISTNAQSELTIGLVMPTEELDGVKPEAYELLRAKLENMLTASGVSSYGGDFVMYPIINIEEEKLIEGGIKNFFKVKIELTLNVVNLTSKTLFSSDSWTLSGTSERIKSDAVKNSISYLRKNDAHFKTFIEQTRRKIYDYYASNKKIILSKASSLASTGEYPEAIALLYSYPAQVEGYSEAQSLLKKVYKKYIDTNASKILNESRAAYATKNYDRAVELASQIDPESSMYAEAKSIINQVRATINNEQNAANKRAMRALEISADIQKTRINASASIARAYYSRRVVNYNFIRWY